MAVDFEIEEVSEGESPAVQKAFTAFDPAVIEDLVDAAFKYMKVSSSTELSIAVVGVEEMERIHLEWMNLPGPTDVMSFPMDELEPGTDEEPTEGVLGDIILCPAVAAEQAENAGHSTLDEYCLLTVHGILHCLGFDHATEEEEAEMFGIQRTILEQFLGRAAPVETRF